jgi:hypothetical protein
VVVGSTSPQLLENEVTLHTVFAPRKKGYYVDGHEKAATIQYQWDFCKRYLGYDQRMHKWIQIPSKEAAFMEEKGEVTRGSSCRRGNRVFFLGFQQEFLPSGFSEEEKW